MKTDNKLFLSGCTLILLLSFIGCGGGSSTSTEGTTESTTESTTETELTTETTVSTTYKADSGRLLGAQCAQCHGTNGVSDTDWDSIAGESELEQEFFDDEPIMSAQAHGYTNNEITLIGNWLKTLNKND